MTVIPFLNGVLSTYRTHACAQVHKLAHKTRAHTRIPGCAEVNDKIARIFQLLKEYERAATHFQVNSIVFALLQLKSTIFP